MWQRLKVLETETDFFDGEQRIRALEDKVGGRGEESLRKRGLIITGSPRLRTNRLVPTGADTRRSN
jgi:hypothetical protein